MTTATRTASSNWIRVSPLLISLFVLVVVIIVNTVEGLQERSAAAAIWTPDRIEMIRNSPTLRQELAEINELCRNFEKQICHYAYKASRTIREADLEEKNAALAQTLRRGRP
jgi:hypothetical protein